VEKMYSYRWAILRIKYFLSFSCNKRVFSIKKFRFHIYIPGRSSSREKNQENASMAAILIITG